MGRPTGQLERSLEAISLDLHDRARLRHRGISDIRTGEYEQQVQVEVTGAATPTWVYADQAVGWEIPFLDAPGQRRSEVTRPHFTPGFELISSGGTLILLTAHVLGWITTDEGWWIGAQVQFAAQAPLIAPAANPVPYSAMAHLTFRGYGAPAEGDEFTQ